VTRATNAIVVFVAACYAQSIVLSLAIGLTGGHESRLIGLGYLSMFLPAFSVLIVKSVMNEPVRVQWNRFPAKYLPLALFLFPTILHSVMVPLMARINGRLPWQAWLTPQADGLFHAPAAQGWGELTFGGLVERVAINAVAGVAIVSFLAFFEEIGWRGWLFPRVTDLVGPRRAVLITSIIWALWHVPFELSGILHINGTNPITLALVMPFGTMATGLIIGWLWLRTESIWLVSIAHGSLNNWGQYAFKYMEESTTSGGDLFVLSMGSLAVFIAGVLLLTFAFPIHRARETARPVSAAPGG
jgi:uncharacterized protein